MSCHRIGPSRLWFLFLVASSIFACTSNSHNEASGTLRFSAEWPSQRAASNSENDSRIRTAEDVCTLYDIETISAKVINQNGQTIASGKWPCDTPGHTGTIDHIPLGSHLQVAVEGVVQGTVQWRGHHDEITMVAGQTYDCGKIEMAAIQQFTIAASSGNGGRIEPSGNVVAEEGADQAFLIYADTGYQITDLLIDGVSIGPTDSYSFSNVTADHSIEASFEPRTFSITATASSGGTISPSGTTTISAGMDQVYSFEPNPGYQIAAVTVDGRNEGVVPNYSFHSISADHIISASFIAVRYVDGHSPGSGDGTTWTQAFQTIPEAIIATVNENADEIWVRKGNYVQRDALQVSSAVKLYGGFAGTELHRGQRRIGENTTTIDGLNTAHGMTITADAVLDGFVVQNGGEMDMGTITGEGGGIYLPADANIAPTIANCVIQQNKAEDGAGIYVGRGNSPKIVNCEFSLNEATVGGGGYIASDSNARLTGCRFIQNSAGTNGGGLFNIHNTVTITNSLFRHNSAGTAGGGIMNYDNAASTIINCTFFENQPVAFGGGMHNWSSSPTITNSIFWHTTLGLEDKEIDNDASHPSVSYCNVRGGYPGTGNIDADPLFTDREYDLIFSLKFGSPCIDAGSDIAPGIPEIDFEGRPRISDGDGDGTARVDMGAYEYTP